MNKKILIRNNELIYYSESLKQFVCVNKNQLNYVDCLEYVLQHDENFNEKDFIDIVKNKNDNIVKYSDGKIEEQNNKIFVKIENSDKEKEFNDKFEMPQSLINTINELKEGGYSFSRFEKFWERCLKNPNPYSVMRLFDFLKSEKIQIFEDGCFMAYKGVRKDFYDIYTGKILNKIGTFVEIERSHVLYDPNTGCAEGLHCGSYNYATEYANYRDGIVVCVKVDPSDVVSVPNDCSYQKIRVCKYLI